MSKKSGKSSYVKMQQGNQRSGNVRTKQNGAQRPSQKNEKERGVGLLKYLSFRPEYRQDGQTTPPLEEGMGRFKYFWEVGKRRNSSILMANLMFVLFALPLVACFIFVIAMGGVEKIAYLMQNMSAPYLLQDVGFGISSQAYSTADVYGYIEKVYYLIFTVAGALSIILSLGLSGMMPLCMKFITGDTFASKKDNYGNAVPKAIKEFFLGIKKYWWQFLIVGGVFFVLLAGVGNAFVFFVSAFKVGTAGVGHWFLVIFAGIIGLLTLMFTLHLMPTIVLYDMPFVEKMKNSAIFTFQMFLQNFFVIAVFSAPFLILGLTNTIVSSIVLAVLLVYGSKYYCLTMCNYEQYLSEKIISPVYNSRVNFNEKRKKKNKK